MAGGAHRQGIGTPIHPGSRAGTVTRTRSLGKAAILTRRKVAGIFGCHREANHASKKFMRTLRLRWRHCSDFHLGKHRTAQERPLVLLLTGPGGEGKSMVLRQTLLVLLERDQANKVL